MKTYRSLPAFLGLLAILVSSSAKADFPLISSAAVAGAASGSLIYRLTQSPATGDLYAAGAIKAGAGNSDIWIGRYNSGLVLLSTYTYDKAGFGDEAFAVAVDTATNDVFAAGYVSSDTANSSRDVWLARFNSSLVLQSSVAINGSASDRDEATCLRISSGIVFVVGLSSVTGGKGFWLARFDTNFVLLSSANFYQNNAEVWDFLETAGGVFVAGSRAPNFLVSNDTWIGKFDSNLVFVASATYNGPASATDHINGLADDGSGGVYAVGIVYSATLGDQYIAHYDSNLVRVGSTTVNGPGNLNEILSGVTRTAAGTILVAGTYGQVAGLGGQNISIAEYDSNLAKLSSGSYTSSGNASDWGYAVLAGANQDVYAAGYAANAGSQDMWLGRFSTNPAYGVYPAAGFAGTAQSSSSILWNWTDNSSHETGYRVMSDTVNVSGDLAANATTWLQTGLAANTTSGALFAQAFNLAGTADSGSATRYALSDPPNSITATFFGSSVAFTWPAMSNPPGTLWSVERGTDGVSYASQLYYSSAAAAFTDAGLGAATTYYYRIRSANGDGLYSFHANASASVFTGGSGYPGCAVTNNVGSGQYYATISTAVAALPATLTGNVCVVIRDGATYAEQVTVQGFTNNGFSITILADPASGLTPVVSPPLASTAAFLIANASVSVLGINIAPTNAIPYGIFISSTYVQISSVNVQDAGGKIATAGVVASSWTTVNYTSVTVGGANVSGFWLPGITMASVSYSTAAANSATAYALRIIGASFNTITATYLVNLPGAGAYLQNSNNNTITRSSIACDNGTGSNAALYLTNSSSNTVTQTYLRNSYADAISIKTTSNYNVISQSTAVLTGAGGQAAIGLTGSSYNSVSGCLLTAIGGLGVNLGTSDFNTISQTTMSITSGMGYHALRFNVASSNTVTQCYVSNPGDTAVAYQNGATYNVLSQSTIIGGPSSNAYPSGVYLLNGSFNTITQSNISNPGGYGVTFGGSALRNTISVSTITGAAVSYSGLFFNSGSATNTVSNSYIQGSTAAFLINSVGSSIDSSVLVATSPMGNALWLTGGSVNLNLVADTFIGGQTGAGVFLDSNNTGMIVFSSNVIKAARYGLLISTQSAGASLAVTTMTFASLASGATAVQFTGGTLVSTFTAMNFDSSVAVNVNGSLLNTASRITMNAHSGPRTDAAYENDPNSLVDWQIVSAPNAPTAFAGTAQSTTSILWSWMDNSSDELGFRLMAGTTNVSGDLAANTTTWLQSGLTANTTSGSLLVRAFNAGGTADSGSATRYSLAAVPSGLAASGVGLGAATLSWASAGNPAGTVYALERSTGTGFGLLRSSTALSFSDLPLTSASTYYYRVNARNADLVVSAYTSTLTVVTFPVPVYPILTSISPSSAATGTSLPAAVVGAGFDASAVLTLERTQVDQGAWTTTGTFINARMLGTLTKLRDGRVLLAGGQIEGAAPGLPYADLYDPASGTWTPTNRLVEGRNQFASVLLPDGRILAAGGTGPSGTFIKTAEIYDPVSSSWTAAASMLNARNGFQMAVLADGRVLAAGGWDGASNPAAAEIYDPAANTWSSGGSMALGRVFPTMTTLRNGKILVTGDSGAATTTAELYDPAGNSWAATGSMSVGRFEHQAVMLPDGRVLVAGGRGASVTNTAEVYDPATGLWTATSPMSSARFELGLISVSGVPLAIAGQNTTSAVASTEIYDAVLNSWRAGPSLAAIRYNALTVVLDDGKILVAGGRTGGAGAPNANTAELLVMPTAQITATGVTVTDAQNLNGTVNLAGAATGYWDVVVRELGGRTGRLSGGFQVASIPLGPSGFAGAAQSADAILWSWTDNATNEAGLRVMSGGANISGDLSANATSWLQTGLSSNTAYGPYFARAFNVAGTTDSATGSKFTLAAPPSGLAAAGVYLTSGTLSWNANGNPGGTVFRLERSTGTGYGLQFAGPATYYLESYLTPSTTYVYRVLALNGEAVATAYSSTLTVVTVLAPPLPGAAGTPVGTALGTSSASWTWALASGATDHYLFRPSDNSYLGSSVSGPFMMTALSPNTAYGLRAAGVNFGGTGPLSSPATVYTSAAVPAAAAAASITSTTMVASWGLNGNPGATVAQLERSTDAVVYTTLSSAAVVSYADADLLGCTTYYYRVRNYNGDGLATAYASFQGLTANTIPSPPSGLSAAANAGGTVSLSWGLSPTEGVTAYYLYWDSGSGTVSYGAPLGVLTSTETAYTTGVLASSAAYTFALRAAHRCGVVETAGALAMSGAAAAPAAVRAAIKEPDSGRRINGDRVTILGELIAGTPGDVQQVLFQYKLAASTAWTDVDEANVNHTNPDFSFPYFVHADVTVLAAGSYDLRAVAYNTAGVPDPTPPAVRVVVDPVTPDIRETLTIDGKIKKDQSISNAVTSVVDTCGAGASDPAVRVTIPPGIVSNATATVSVTANPVITTAAPTGQTMVGSSIKIDLSNGQTALNGTAEITLTYPDTVLFPSLLQIYYLNEATGQWSRDFNSTVDTTNRTVTGRTPHFSTFAIMLGTSFGADLSNVRAYPVPFMPNGVHADEGRSFTAGDPNSGIIFSNLPSGSEIRIYTLTGRLVASLDSPALTGTVRWDVRNQDGRDVASGAYFAVITASGHKSVVKKLVIIR